MRYLEGIWSGNGTRTHKPPAWESNPVSLSINEYMRIAAITILVLASVAVGYGQRSDKAVLKTVFRSRRDVWTRVGARTHTRKEGTEWTRGGFA